MLSTTAVVALNYISFAHAKNLYIIFKAELHFTLQTQQHNIPTFFESIFNDVFQ